MVVEAYLCGKASTIDLAAKHKISTADVLLYNANRMLRDYDPKREVYMTEAQRKTTLEERKESDEHCISYDRDYKEAASWLDFSYSQVYSCIKNMMLMMKQSCWIGMAHKSDEEVDELERLHRGNIRLKRQLEKKIW